MSDGENGDRMVNVPVVMSDVKTKPHTLIT